MVPRPGWSFRTSSGHPGARISPCGPMTLGLTYRTESGRCRADTRPGPWEGPRDEEFILGTGQDGRSWGGPSHWPLPNLRYPGTFRPWSRPELTLRAGAILLILASTAQVRGQEDEPRARAPRPVSPVAVDALPLLPAPAAGAAAPAPDGGIGQPAARPRNAAGSPQAIPDGGRRNPRRCRVPPRLRKVQSPRIPPPTWTR